MELDLNAQNPSTNNYVLSSLTCIDHLYDSNDSTSLFDSYPTESEHIQCPTHLHVTIWWPKQLSHLKASLIEAIGLAYHAIFSPKFDGDYNWMTLNQRKNTMPHLQRISIWVIRMRSMTLMVRIMLLSKMRLTTSTSIQL